MEVHSKALTGSPSSRDAARAMRILRVRASAPGAHAARPFEAAPADPVFQALRTLCEDGVLQAVPGCREALAEIGDSRSRGRPVDVVVLEGSLSPPEIEFLERLRGAGPPVVFVGSTGSEQLALEAFRRGASDCVLRGPDFAEVLREAVLQQRFRAHESRDTQSMAERIRTLEGFNQSIVQSVNSALLVVDSSGKVTFANTTAAEILELQPSASPLLGRSIWDWFQESRTKGDTLARTLRTGDPLRVAETLVTRSDGRVLPIGVSAAPLRASDGTTSGAVAIFQDRSDIMQLREQVLQTEKMASIGQLAAGVAHEINNPMGFIHANLFQMTEYLSDLRRYLSAVDEALKGTDLSPSDLSSAKLGDLSRELELDFVMEDFGKAVRECQEGAERVRHIVQDLREFSHPDEGQLVLADVNQCVDSTAGIVWTMMKHTATLERNYGELPSVLCFPMQLKQVFMNLLVNAYQAIEEQVRDAPLKDGAMTGKIEIATRLAGEGVEISVRDSGVGIAPQNLDRIFDPFFTTKRVGDGTGLGLSTSYGIVLRHGGRIRAESNAGGGAVFVVWLPVKGPTAEDSGD